MDTDEIEYCYQVVSEMDKAKILGEFESFLDALGCAKKSMSENPVIYLVEKHSLDASKETREKVWDWREDVLLDDHGPDRSQEDIDGLFEDSHPHYAVPEGDRKAAYQNAKKYADEQGRPFIYGYTDSAKGGKFFALQQPIRCSEHVEKDRADFAKSHKTMLVCYVAYPAKSESCEKGCAQSRYDFSKMLEDLADYEGDAFGDEDLEDDSESEPKIDLYRLANDILNHNAIEGVSYDETKKMIDDRDDFIWSKLAQHGHTDLFEDEDEMDWYCSHHRDEIFNELQHQLEEEGEEIFCESLSRDDDEDVCAKAVCGDISEHFTDVWPDDKLLKEDAPIKESSELDSIPEEELMGLFEDFEDTTDLKSNDAAAQCSFCGKVANVKHLKKVADGVRKCKDCHDPLESEPDNAVKKCETNKVISHAADEPKE